MIRRLGIISLLLALAEVAPAHAQRAPDMATLDRGDGITKLGFDLGWSFLNDPPYDSALRFFPNLTNHYVVARLVVTNLVWLGYSFPLWHVVFRERAARTALAPGARPDTQNTSDP